MPLDGYPVHQVPLPTRPVATGGPRIFRILGSGGCALLIAGLGVHGRLGVIDACATLERFEGRVPSHVMPYTCPGARLLAATDAAPPGRRPRP